MKIENTSSAVENTESKQVWIEPTLVILAVSLETFANATAGGDANSVVT